MLKTENITLAYQDHHIINDVSIHIPDQKITVLIGANGCGKSTILKSLGRLLLPTSGRVTLNAQNIYQASGKKIASSLAMLSQSEANTENITVAQLVRYGRYPHQHFFSAWQQEDEDAVENALELTQTKSLATKQINTLSGGQRQRVWIAMTLAQNTPYLLLDEPTTYLDLCHQIEILDLLKNLNITQHKTIVMVLHDLNLACRYAHHIIAIKDGGIYTQGTPKQTMTEDNVFNVFGLSSKIITDPIYQTPLCIPLSTA